MEINNIFFDFDGVIAESVSVKTEAFRDMYIKYDKKIAQDVVNYHLDHGGVSRFEKFKYWEKKYFDRDISKQELEKLAQEFSNKVIKKIIESKSVPGVKKFLEKYSNKMNFWIITGTPTSEILVIAKERNLSQYFKGIHGSPENKKYWTEFLIRKYDLNRDKTLFLGDATTDYDAAKFSNLHFALRENDENKDKFETYNGLRFKDFFELEAQLN